jgi:hypothetical protein
MLPSSVTNNRSNSSTRDTSGRNRGGRGRGGRRNNRNAQSRETRLPDHEVATLASQLQDYFRIQAQRYPASSSQPPHPRGPAPPRSSYNYQTSANTRPSQFGAHSTIAQHDDGYWAPWEETDYHAN